MVNITKPDSDFGKGGFAFAYYRLSREEAQRGESSSISNQKKIVEAYCEQNGIVLTRFFVDDGWSGGNFERPGFQEMMRALESGSANMVITKDLSRLGRDMRESSYYAEQYFPEHRIRYLAIADNFDSERENVMAPFQFAMNEVYLRDGSRKIRDVLQTKRSRGEYCACPPYGYRKDPENRDRLIPDELTAPVVRRIFQSAAQGLSCGKIAAALTDDGILPPLKYRVCCRDSFSEAGAARAVDHWNGTTVKRILKNRVYLGDTVLGKSRKLSVKSKKKVPIPRDSWVVTEGTHTPLVEQEMFQTAQANLGRASRDYRQHENVRKSIFAGVAVCGKCGHALCSYGTVYKGDREKYWFLGCNHTRKSLPDACTGVRIRYADLCEIIRQDLNRFISLTDAQMDRLVGEILESSAGKAAEKKAQMERAEARLAVIDRMVTKLYMDNAAGVLSNQRLGRLVTDLEKESASLEAQLAQLRVPESEGGQAENYQHFFGLVRQHAHIESLTREDVLTFVQRIEVGPKVYPEGANPAARKNPVFSQSIRIHYRFIGEFAEQPLRAVPEVGETPFDK